MEGKSMTVSYSCFNGYTWWAILSGPPKYRLSCNEAHWMVPGTYE